MFLSISYSSFSQSNTTRSSNENLDIEELPEIVLSKIGDDFSIYLPDKNPDLSVRQLQKYFVAYDLGKDFEGYENYLVMMKNDKGTLTASYNEKGKLTRVVEKYENVFKITEHPDSLREPYRWKKRRVVFVNSMSDLFHKEIPLEFIQKVFKVMNDNPQHVFQVLTKRAERLLELHKELKN